MHLQLNSIRNRYLLALDAVLLIASVALAYYLRFAGATWGVAEVHAAEVYALVAVPLKLFIFFQSGLYRRLWRYASATELERLLVAIGLASLGCLVLGAVILPLTGLVAYRIPVSILVMDALLTAGVVTLPRLLLRLSRPRGRPGRRQGEPERRVLIAGAGAAGVTILKELSGNPHLGLIPIGFVDDDVQKHHQKLGNLPVLGSLSDIPDVVAQYAVDEVVIAIPTASGRVIREVVRLTLDAGAKARTVPGISDILSGRVAVTALRQVEIQDLLRREPIVSDFKLIGSLATGEVVLVTGAGGSIGSELCRQLARLRPRQIVLLGHGENSIFDICNELRETFPGIEAVPVIADVRDRERLRTVLGQYRPFAVFHAAAHKHVPLMEANVTEAVLNNVLGTRNVAELSAEVGVEHMVLISTDKAVRPTNVMGATKRLAEQIVQHVAETTGRNFVAVRFGNVLGSRGSVIPTFLRQIQAGGQVTVTHPEMRRYFMTIPEAVQLVLHAGALGRGGEVFVLDMGEPVRILDLATDLIRLSGLEVGVDVEIRFTGIRPGEKLYEELFFASEKAIPTAHPKVLRAKNGSLPPGLAAELDMLIDAARRVWPDEALVGMLAGLVPDYQPTSVPVVPLRIPPAPPKAPMLQRVAQG